VQAILISVRVDSWNEVDLACSFCGQSRDQVNKLVAGPGVYICDECIDLCHKIVTEDLGKPESPH